MASPESFGYIPLPEDEPRLGFLLTAEEATDMNTQYKKLESGLRLYFMDEKGRGFSAFYPYHPYILVVPAQGCLEPLKAALQHEFPETISSIEEVEKVDLESPDHLIGERTIYLRVSFFLCNDAREALKRLRRLVSQKQRDENGIAFATLAQRAAGQPSSPGIQIVDTHDADTELQSLIEDLREHDLVYLMRVFIDREIRCCQWYEVLVTQRDQPSRRTLLHYREDIAMRPGVRVLAFDIETEKAPLKFPDSQRDRIMMISYMIDGRGFLIINREVVSMDIDDFEFTPRPEFPGPFTVWNEPNEAALLRRWFSHVREVKPAIMVTYNGDFFDFPFIDKRAEYHGMSMRDEIGYCDISSPSWRPKDDSAKGGRFKEAEYRCTWAIHLDCFKWVQRDSYLPQGSQGLKAVTRAKLGYDPHELDPELMLPYAHEHPQVLADYSVSDAVSTYYLYMKYVHPFIFALSTIIPLCPDDVLRRGTGTMCESMLCTSAYRAGVVMPERARQSPLEFMPHTGQLLSAQTFIGATVAALNSGVYRSDTDIHFHPSAETYQLVINRLDVDLEFALQQAGIKRSEITNYNEVRSAISSRLESLRDQCGEKGWEERPVLYHLDVGAMYPNIILTNRIQPNAMRTPDYCATCQFCHEAESVLRPESAAGPSGPTGMGCQRRLEWVWRGEVYTADRSEVQRQIQHLSQFDRNWAQLSQAERASEIKAAVGKASRASTGLTKETVMEKRLTVVCQRENSFYVDTVRMFRDRRYVFKVKLKEAARDLAKGIEAHCSGAERERLEAQCVLYESMQLAYKCILNSFYGYVMRTGARWLSMPMGGTVTYTGSRIIKQACDLSQGLGVPLELDTDGIWVAFPASFPDRYEFKGPEKKLSISYPCIMLNALTWSEFVNPQYHTLTTPALAGVTPYPDRQPAWTKSKECSIFFEVDGPYHAMVLPAALQQGKSIKKRYAVFNFDGSLAELKGFELKRRGELQLVKQFQQEIFPAFLLGSSVEESYASAAEVANRWLDIIDMRGAGLTQAQLLELISESTTMQKTLQEFQADGRKMAAMTTAERMGALLGDDMIQERGLRCEYVISRLPQDQPVTQRTVPVQVFSADPLVARKMLSRWTGDPDPGGLSDVLDWGYYRERLERAILKIIVLPAIHQIGRNPVPRVALPDWAEQLQHSRKTTQTALNSFFSTKPRTIDIEDAAQLVAPQPAAELPNDPSPEPPKVDEPMPPVSNLPEHVRWLRKYWAQQRRAGPRNMGGSMSPGVKSVVQSRWHILSVSPGNRPGVLSVHALLESNITSAADQRTAPLRQFDVQVPRDITINWANREAMIAFEGALKAIEPRAEISDERRRLPHGRSPITPRRYIMEETTFIRLRQDIDSAAAAGVYGADVSPLLVFSAQVGGLCTVTGRDHSRGALWSMRDLQFSEYMPLVPCANAELNQTPEKLRAAPQAALLRCTGIAFFHRSVGRNSIAIVTIQTYSQKCASFTDPGIPARPATHVVLLGDGASRSQLQTAHEEVWAQLENQLREELAGLDRTLGVPVAGVAPRRVVVHRADSLAALPTTVLEALRTAGAEADIQLGPSVSLTSALGLVCLFSPYMHQARMVLNQAAQTLPDGLAVAEFPLPQSDLPAMIADYHQAAFTISQQHLVRLPLGLSRQAALAQAASVPLSLLPPGAGAVRVAIDVLLARRLLADNQVLWSNRHGSLPPLQPLTIDEPCFRRTISFRINVDNLTFAAVAATSETRSDEVDGPHSVRAREESELIPTTAVQPVLKQLQALARDWAVATTAKSTAAKTETAAVVSRVRAYGGRVMAASLAGWLRSPSSALFDPSLAELVHQRERVMLLTIAAGLEKAGFHVISADVTHFTVTTRFSLPARAESAARSAIQAISSTLHYVSLRVSPPILSLLHLGPADEVAVSMVMPVSEVAREQRRQQAVSSEMYSRVLDVRSVFRLESRFSASLRLTPSVDGIPDAGQSIVQLLQQLIWQPFRAANLGMTIARLEYIERATDLLQRGFAEAGLSISHEAAFYLVQHTLPDVAAPSQSSLAPPPVAPIMSSLAEVQGITPGLLASAVDIPQVPGSPGPAAQSQTSLTDSFLATQIEAALNGSISAVDLARAVMSVPEVTSGEPQVELPVLFSHSVNDAMLTQLHDSNVCEYISGPYARTVDAQVAAYSQLRLSWADIGGPSRAQEARLSKWSDRPAVEFVRLATILADLPPEAFMRDIRLLRDRHMLALNADPSGPALQISRQFILQNYICTECGALLDYDLAANPSELPRCRCGTLADPSRLEASLVAALSALQRELVVTDPCCPACHQTMVNPFTSSCQCTRLWQRRHDVSRIVSDAEFLRRFALLHDMTWLSQVAETFISNKQTYSPFDVVERKVDSLGA